MKLKVAEVEELERDEGLAQLMPDIQATATLVTSVTDRLEEAEQDVGQDMNIDRLLPSSVEERYLTFMKNLQFGMLQHVCVIHSLTVLSTNSLLFSYFGKLN